MILSPQKNDREATKMERRNTRAQNKRKTNSGRGELRIDAVCKENYRLKMAAYDRISTDGYAYNAVNR